MNTKFSVDYLLDEESNTIQIKSISLSPKSYVRSPDDNKALFINEGVLYYTSSSKKYSTKVLRTEATYRSGAFHARRHLIERLLKKWSLSSKEVEVPIKITMPSEAEWKQVLLPKKIKTVSKTKSKVRPKVKLGYSSPGIQVDVIRMSLSNSYLVTRVQALPQEKLPPIYTDEEPEYTLPRVWQDGDTLVANNHHVLLCTGNTYSYGELKKALLYIELAGRHLTVANQHIKLLQAKWAKSNVITFRDGCPLKATTFQKRKEVDWGSLYSCFRSCSIC